MEETRYNAAWDMVYLSACALTHTKPDANRVQTMDLEALFKMCCSHSLEALVFWVLEPVCDPAMRETPILAEWRSHYHGALRKNILMEIERTRVFAFLEQQNIWYMPLKGTILRQYYPLPELRQMCDTDILYDKSYRQTVCDWFVKNGYDAKCVDLACDDCFYKKPVYNFEMHRRLFDESHDPVWVKYYTGVENKLLTTEGSSLRRFRDEDFYVYLLAHGTKHHDNGGTGLRTLLDCFVYRRAKAAEWDTAYIGAQLEQLGLTDFERMLCDLCDSLFTAENPGSIKNLSAEQKQELEYILFSGTYGTKENMVKHGLEKIGDTDSLTAQKIKYLRKRLFPCKMDMDRWCDYRAPFFSHHPWLKPLAVPYRLLFGLVHAKNQQAELNALRSSGEKNQSRE